MTDTGGAAIRLARRKHLDGVAEAKCGHPGLLLSRYLKLLGDQHSAQKELYRQATEIDLNQTAYAGALARWKQVLEARGAFVFSGTTAGPLAVGLGNESPLENGLTTHHTYGAPVIPGSALKGLCRRGAALLLCQGQICGDQFRVLFGDTKAASAFVFHDAWYDPGSVEGKPFHRDVVTVHHPAYYQHSQNQPGRPWPTDFDDPNPIPFLAVRPGAGFLFAFEVTRVGGDREKWETFVASLLRWSLENLGAGGKTNAGYGYFQFGASQKAGAEKASGGSTAGFSGNREVWADVTVNRNPGNGELTAISGNRQARASGKTAIDALLSSLPETALAALRGKDKRITADVEVEMLGNRITIVGIIPKG